MKPDTHLDVDNGQRPQHQVMRLLHDLQVHQVELQAQNEELISSRLELEIEKARYVELYDCSPTGNVRLQRKGDIVSCNLSAASILGKVRSYLIGKTFVTFLIENDQPVFAHCLQQVFSTGATTICTVLLNVSDGQPRMLQCVVARSPHVNECTVVLVDNPQVLHTQQALTDTEQRWELAVRGANDGLWDWNHLTGYVYYSDRWKSILGYAPHELGEDLDVWESRIHPSDYSRVMLELNRHLAGKSSFYEQELRLRCKDGSYKWTYNRGRTLFDDAGHVLRMVGSLSDITDRRAADARVADRTAQLDTIFALSPDAFVSFDHEMRVKFANPSFTKMTGFPETALIGLGAIQFSEQLARLCKVEARFSGLAALIAKQQVNAGKVIRADSAGPQDRLELIEIADASQRILEVRLRASDAESASQILYFRDVTQEKEVERLKSEFLSTVAHELRTPMAGVFGYSELLLAHEFTAQEQRKYLKIIHKQSGLMTNILNELLDLARIDARRGKDFKLLPLEVGALINEVITETRIPIDFNIPMIEVATEAYWVSADRGKLIQALTNVLSNAQKYSPSGGSVTVALISETRDNDLQYLGIRIKDHGIGMSPPQLASVFERFYRADESGNVPGTGLGMSIVKEIIELHGGHIEIGSTLGKGTTVTMWLPLLTNVARDKSMGATAGAKNS